MPTDSLNNWVARMAGGDPNKVEPLISVDLECLKIYSPNIVYFDQDTPEITKNVAFYADICTTLRSTIPERVLCGLYNMLAPDGVALNGFMSELQKTRWQRQNNRLLPAIAAGSCHLPCFYLKQGATLDGWKRQVDWKLEELHRLETLTGKKLPIIPLLWPFWSKRDPGPYDNPATWFEHIPGKIWRGMLNHIGDRVYGVLVWNYHSATAKYYEWNDAFPWYLETVAFHTLKNPSLYP